MLCRQERGDNRLGSVVAGLGWISISWGRNVFAVVEVDAVIDGAMAGAAAEVAIAALKIQFGDAEGKSTVQQSERKAQWGEERDW